MATENFLTLLEKEQPTIKAMLPSTEDRDRWWAVCYEMTKRPELREVAEKNPISLINAIKKFADWGLIPDGEEGFINVYGGEAVPERMWKGLTRMAIDGGAIMHAVADLIREGDTLEESIGREGRCIKVQKLHGKRGRKIIGGYVLFWLPNGLMDYELFDEDDIEAVKKAAIRLAERKKPGAGLSPAWRFFEGEQVKKSVTKRGLKRMRGRRDTDAGRRFAEMMAEKSFDLDVTAELPPDNLPETPEWKNGQVGVRPDGSVDAAAMHQKLVDDERKRREAVAIKDDRTFKDDRTLNDAEQKDELRFAKAKGLKLGDITTILSVKFDVQDLSELRVSQIPDFEAACG